MIGELCCSIGAQELCDKIHKTRPDPTRTMWVA